MNKIIKSKIKKIRKMKKIMMMMMMKSNKLCSNSMVDIFINKKVFKLSQKPCLKKN